MLKKKMGALFVSFLMVFSSVLVVGQEPFVDAGVTPDSFFHGIDLWYEDFQYKMAETFEEETSLLTSFTEERLAEAHEMVQEEKYDSAQVAIEEAVEDLNSLQEHVDSIG